MVIVVEHRRSRAVFVSVTTMVVMVGVGVVMLVVPQVMGFGLAAFVQAIRLHGRPDGLERQQYQQEKGDPSTHGPQYIGRPGAQHIIRRQWCSESKVGPASPYS